MVVGSDEGHVSSNRNPQHLQKAHWPYFHLGKLRPAPTPMRRGSLSSTDQYLIEINASTSLHTYSVSLLRRNPGLGGEAMATVADYRKWAEECFEWARQASDESVREQYASLGRVWLEYAARAELRSSSEPKVA